ncbi:MAG: DMT family transporter [Clostridium sp.]
MNGDKLKGIGLIVLTAILLSIMGVFIKLAGHVPTAEKLVYRNLLSIIVSFIIILKSKGTFFGTKDSRKALIIRTIVGTIGILANIYAISHMLLANASMLSELSPFFVIIFSYIFLKENIKWTQIIALVLAFIGMIFVIHPSGDKFQLLAALGALLSAVMAGAAYTTMRYLGPIEKPVTVVFFYTFISSLLCLPFMIHGYVPLTMKQFIYLMLSGVAVAGAEFTVVYAYKFAAAKEISLYTYSGVIFSAIFGFLVWGKLPKAYDVIGYVIIIIAAIILFLYNTRSEKA